MASHGQPMRKQNIETLVEFFESGIKSNARSIGIELEHTLVKDDGAPVSYSDEFGQKWLLGQLASNFDSEIRTSAGDLIGLVREDASVTLEPAAQVELSAGPFERLDDAKKCFEKFEGKLACALEGHSIDVLTPGYHPTKRAIDLELIPKTRYKIMNEYLGAISSFGIYMMRGSASTQVAIDYTSVDDCLRKLRLANACVPVFSLICDNAPMFEAAARPHKLMRTEIWEKCDPARCGIVDGVMEGDFSLERYAAYILDAPAMVEVQDGREVYSSRTIGEIFADRVMGTADIEHVLSVFFTDVRLKTYIEIRPADAMPIEYAIGYAALVKGLFYNEGSLASMDEMFAGVSEGQIVAAKASLMQDGYDGQAYGRPVAEIADELVSLAGTGLDGNEAGLLEPIASLVANRTTLADIALRDIAR